MSVLPPPRRSLRFVLAIVVVGMLSPIVAFLAWSRVEANRLDSAFDALEAREESLDVDDFDPKPATGEQREASHLYAQAMRLVANEPLERFRSMATTVEELCSAPGEPPASAQVAALEAVEAPHRHALALLDRAAGLDAVGWEDADRPRRNSMEQLRAVILGQVNAVRVARLACTGQGDQAARALLAGLRLQRVSAPPSRRVAASTTHSLHAVLTFTSADVSLLQKIQDEYENAADEHSVARQVRYMRAAWLHYALPGVVSDSPSGYVPARVSPVGAVAMRLVRPMRDHSIVRELREFDEALVATSGPWPAKLDAATAMTARYRYTRSQSRRRGWFDRLTRPYDSHQAATALEGVVRSAAETLARTRASAAAVAVVRYRQAHGTLPGSLQALIPEYLATSIVDPYTGGELKYVLAGAGYKVYALGINRTDDGGRWDLNSDLQTSRRGNPPDVGITVGRLTDHPN
jgi:hypothetical protein